MFIDIEPIVFVEIAKGGIGWRCAASGQNDALNCDRGKRAQHF
jgi:hypothetical protein